MSSLRSRSSSVVPFPSLHPSSSQVEPSVPKKKQTRLGVLVRSFSKRAGSLNDSPDATTTSVLRSKRNRTPSGDVPNVKKRRPETSGNEHDFNECLPLRQRMNSSTSVKTIRAVECSVQKPDAATSKKRPLREDSANISDTPSEATSRVKRTRLISGVTPDAKKRCAETSTTSQAWPRPRTTSSTSVDTIRLGSVDCPKVSRTTSPLPTSDTSPEILYTSSGDNDAYSRYCQRNPSTSSVDTLLGVGIDDLIGFDSKPSRIPVPKKTPSLAILNPGTGKPAEAVLTPSSSGVSEAIAMPSLKRKAAIDFRSLPPEDTELIYETGWLPRDSCDRPDRGFRGLASVEELEPLPPPKYETFPSINSKPTVKPKASIKLIQQHVELWDASNDDWYVYQAHLHLTTPLSSFDSTIPPNPLKLEITCQSINPGSSGPAYVVYYKGHMAHGDKPVHIHPANGIHISDRWYHSIPKEGGGKGVSGSWGWYMKVWVPIPVKVVLRREMGLFKVGARLWMAGYDEQKEEGGNDESSWADEMKEEEILAVTTEISVSCLKWGKTSTTV